LKGLLKSLEAIIAVLIILTVFITYFGTKEALPEFETITWQLKGFNSLKALDDSNELKNYTKTNNTSGLETRLLSMLPRDIDYEVVICDLTCSDPNIESEKLTSITYLTVGGVNDFQSKQVILYMYRE